MEDIGKRALTGLQDRLDELRDLANFIPHAPKLPTSTGPPGGGENDEGGEDGDNNDDDGEDNNDDGEDNNDDGEDNDEDGEDDEGGEDNNDDGEDDNDDGEDNDDGGEDNEGGEDNVSERARRCFSKSGSHRGTSITSPVSRLMSLAERSDDYRFFIAVHPELQLIFVLRVLHAVDHYGRCLCHLFCYKHDPGFWNDFSWNSISILCVYHQNLHD